jgi:hypothetical protein
VLDELVVELVELEVALVVLVEPGTVVLVETVLDVATVLVVTVIVVAVTAGTAIATGAAIQLAIVSDVQSLANKLLIRPNSL